MKDQKGAFDRCSIGNCTKIYKHDFLTRLPFIFLVSFSPLTSPILVGSLQGGNSIHDILDR